MIEEEFIEARPLYLLSKALKQYAYASIIATISSTFGLLAIILSAFYGNEGILLAFAGLVTIALIVSIVLMIAAYINGRKENEGFNKAFILFLIGMGLSVIHSNIKGSVINIVIEMAGTVLNLLSICFIVLSLNAELKARGYQNLAKMGSNVLMIYAVTIIVVNPIIDYYSGMSSIDLVGRVIAIASLVVSIAAIIYQSMYFFKASKAVVK